MKAIAELVVGDDPYLKLPRDVRIAERRERRSRLFGSLPAQVFNVAPSMVDPPEVSEPDLEPMPAQSIDEVAVWVERQKQNFKEPWFLVEAELNRKLSIREIQEAVAAYYRVTVSGILSARRTHDVIKPRHVAYYLSKAFTTKSLPQIGWYFAGRDHTSILSGVRKIDRLRISDPQLEIDLHKIAASLGQVLAAPGVV